MNPFVCENGKALFKYGDRAEDKAASAAADCPAFCRDYEDEGFYDEDITCYNCRYRRWNNEGFECMKGGCL